jgi:hypothetical protein
MCCLLSNYLIRIYTLLVSTTASTSTVQGAFVLFPHRPMARMARGTKASKQFARTPGAVARQ